MKSSSGSGRCGAVALPLSRLPTEPGIRIEKTADPTKMAEELFTKVKALV